MLSKSNSISVLNLIHCVMSKFIIPLPNRHDDIEYKSHRKDQLFLLILNFYGCMKKLWSCN